jgi:hypothetical protein
MDRDLARAFSTLRAKINAAGGRPPRVAVYRGNLAASPFDAMLSNPRIALVFPPEQWAADAARRRAVYRGWTLLPEVDAEDYGAARYRERAWNTAGGMVPPDPNAPAPKVKL